MLTQERALQDRPRLLIPIAIATALVVFRSFVWIFFEQAHFDSDQAVVGLMAKHLAEGRAFPLFFYGQHYMLGVEAWIAAPIVGAAGASVATLKLPLLAINIAVAALLLWLLVRTVRLTPLEALLASSFFLIPPPLVSARLVEAQGSNIEPFLYVLLLWLLRDRMVAFGLLAGVGFFHREFTVYAIVAVVLVDVLAGRAWSRARLHDYATASGMFLLVAVVIRLLKSKASLLGPGTDGTIDPGGVELQIAAWSQFVCGPGGDLLSNLRWLGQENLGVIFNWKEDLLGPAEWSQTPTGHGWIAAVLLLMSAMAVVQVVRARKEMGSRAQLGAYLMIVGAEAAFAYSMLSCLVRDGTLIRYTLLTLCVPIGLLILFLSTRPAAWLRIGVLALVTLWGSLSLLDTARFLAAYVQHPPPSPARELVDHLEAEGVRYGRGTYWIAYQLDFLSQERLTISSLDKVRVAEYQQIADEHDQQTVHILPLQPDRVCEDGVPFQMWCLHTSIAQGTSRQFLEPLQGSPPHQSNFLPSSTGILPVARDSPERSTIHCEGTMTDGLALARGRELFQRKEWAESYRLLEAADRDAPLDAEDLERLASVAYLLGKDDESETFLARAHQTYVDRGDREAAARSALWLAFGLLQRGAMAPASGWFARVERLLDEAHLESVARGYLLIPTAIQCIVHGDVAGGDAAFKQAAEIAGRFGDRDLASLACQGRGRARIRLGHVAEGVALLDEAMAAVIAGDITPALAGDIYCSVLEACEEIFDLRRAYEWTTSLAQWCAAQPGLVRYRGECLLYRAEVMQMRGRWNDAARDAQDACELLISRPAAGGAFYRLGDIHRLRGEFAKAEAAYTRANERGRKPQPGLSLLRLAQDQTDAAAASIRSVLLDTQARTSRARTLIAAVEILLAAGDLDHARSAVEELSEITRGVGTPFLVAATAYATGGALLAEGDVAGASASLHQAWEIWRELEMPYEEAKTCVLMAAVCERRGDQDGRRLELDTARRLFTQLNAEPRLARIGEPSGRAARQAGSLSDREAQVLRLLAAGKTNREIAQELFISEKTVARHVSNIFDKASVSTRAGATAWAYQHNLI